MLTTAGVTALAMLRNVSALSAPVIGALFIGGTVIVCAIDAGVRSKRDASTIPTASDATATSGTYNKVVFRVDILFSIQPSASGRSGSRAAPTLDQTDDFLLHVPSDRGIALADDHVDLC